jgi:hypothetical protein
LFFFFFFFLILCYFMLFYFILFYVILCYFILFINVGTRGWMVRDGWSGMDGSGTKIGDWGWMVRNGWIGDQDRGLGMDGPGWMDRGPRSEIPGGLQPGEEKYIDFFFPFPLFTLFFTLTHTFFFPFFSLSTHFHHFF